jgi:hypothetical protein
VRDSCVRFVPTPLARLSCVGCGGAIHYVPLRLQSCLRRSVGTGARRWLQHVGVGGKRGVVQCICQSGAACDCLVKLLRVAY